MATSIYIFFIMVLLDLINLPFYQFATNQGDSYFCYMFVFKGFYDKIILFCVSCFAKAQIYTRELQQNLLRLGYTD